MPKHPSLAATEQAVRYLKACGIRLPHFKLDQSDQRVGGSLVQYRPLRLTIGNYPNTFVRNWFAMHEIGHLLWEKHRPLRRMAFRRHFGDPMPEEDAYNLIHKRQSWKTAATHKLSWWAGPHRPSGQPSHYGALAGGEERFCELIALMYAHGDFSKDPPSDLAELWDVCWSEGLPRMG
jgi:hypothetical protein